MSEESPRTGWHVFDGKPVLLQLREPYIGVTHDYKLEQVEGGVRAVPALSGMLSVEPGAEPGHVLLLISRQISRSGDRVVIAVHPKDVVYCSHFHEEARGAES